VHDVTFAPNSIITQMEKPLTKVENVIVSIQGPHHYYQQYGG
jgi:hypothetical protein